MQLIVVREQGEGSAAGRMSLLCYALSAHPLSRAILDGLCHLRQGQKDAAGLAALTGGTDPGDTRWVLPGSWQADLSMDRSQVSFYGDSRTDALQGLDDRLAKPWIQITHGRFATRVNDRLLARALTAANADVIAVNAAPDLLAYQERVRLTQDNDLVGYRRLYTDSVARRPLPTDWPHHLLVRREAFEAVVRGSLLEDFGTLVARCRGQGLRMQGTAVAGVAFDLESHEGILALCRVALRPSQERRRASQSASGPGTADGENGGVVSARSRLIGRVLLGRQVTIEPGAVIIGPAVLCDNCVIQRDAIVESSIVGANVSVAPRQVLMNRLVTASPQSGEEEHIAAAPDDACVGREEAFRVWPGFSYACCIKRVADAISAAVVLALFAPVFPLIALAVKLSSPGPVFFRDKRQGFHGELFDCIKFRTMRQGADKMQDKLRFVSEVDGPQFKMSDDPRITAVGRFLRETYLDEIPQFFNVLCGQMSVVGPRPSPEFENTLCPSWRDARLSVRPGITGLWQVCRTRVAQKDFQEWIHYDMQYVREFSPCLDLWICWRTFKRMVENFVDQF